MDVDDGENVSPPTTLMTPHPQPQEVRLPTTHGQDQGQDSQATPVPVTVKGNVLVFRLLQAARGIRGKGSTKMTFNIPDAAMARVLRWKERTGTLDELRTASLCISLGCYPASALPPKVQTLKRIAELPETCSWPRGGELKLSFVDPPSGETVALSLAPPFVPTPDGTIDLTPFITRGENCFEVQQSREWAPRLEDSSGPPVDSDGAHSQSRVRFLLFAHTPTDAQMKKVEEKRKKDEEWEAWKREMAKPVKIELPPGLLAANLS